MKAARPDFLEEKAEASTYLIQRDFCRCAEVCNKSLAVLKKTCEDKDEFRQAVNPVPIIICFISLCYDQPCYAQMELAMQHDKKWNEPVVYKSCHPLQ